MSFYSKYAGEEVEQRLDAVSEIAGQVGDISGALSEVSGKVGEVSEHLASVDASVVAVGNRVDGVVASVDGVSSRVDANATNIAEVAEKVGSIEKDVDVIDESVGALGERVQELGSLTTSVENLSANVTAIGRGVEQLAERVENVASELDNKQGVLESGVNVKTINGESILGAGDIKVQGSGIGGEVEDVTEIVGNEYVLLMDGDKVLRVPMSVLKAWLGVPSEPSEPDQPDEPTTPDVDENGYIVFADEEVKRVLMTNGVSSDGVGITLADAEKVTDIKDWFKGNTTIESFDELEKFTNVKKLETYAFYQCSNLKSINVTNINTFVNRCIQACSALINIIGVENAVVVNNEAFSDCTSLEIEDLALPNLTSLGQNAFYGVKIKKISNLGKITALPTASLSTQNFGDKSTLEEVVLPDSVTSIPNNSFDGYAAITSIKFQNTITMGEYAFSNCVALSDVDWTKITKVGYGAFMYCTSLPSEIAIPNMTQGIEPLAFLGCTSIIKFSASATSIGTGAFNYCNIEEVTLLNAVSLGASAFNRNYQLKVVRLRDVTTFIGDVFYACGNLKAVIVDNTTPPSLSNDAFASASGTFIIYVPDASVEAYKTATNWSTYASRIKGISELSTDNAELYE